MGEKISSKTGGNQLFKTVDTFIIAYAGTESKQATNSCNKEMADSP
ncbi:MAG: hypothetical protein IPP72_03710 [Chitinophagaceae bacterium]|nr:hypothetical protein [Chitinophagaceae bacterium]